MDHIQNRERERKRETEDDNEDGDNGSEDPNPNEGSVGFKKIWNIFIIVCVFCFFVFS